jgi:rod shape-determining protein MreD
VADPSSSPFRAAGGRIATDIYLTLALLSVIVLVQTTLLARVRLLGASPNLLLAATVSWSLLRGVTGGLLWGFFGGLGLDLITGMPLGTSSLGLMTICFLAELGTTNVFTGNLLLPVVIVALATPIYGWIVLLTEQVRGLPIDWLANTLRVIAPETLLNGLMILLTFPVLRWVTPALGMERVGL